MSDIQVRLHEEYVGLYNQRPSAGQLLAFEGHVYKYLGTGTPGAGVWRPICAQVKEPGIDFVLATNVVVTLPPMDLLTAILRAKTPSSPEQATGIVQALVTVLKMAGWEHPKSAALEVTPGTVEVVRKDKGSEVLHQTDIRGTLAMLQDPSVRSVLVEGNSDYRWINLENVEEVIVTQLGEETEDA